MVNITEPACQSKYLAIAEQAPKE